MIKIKATDCDARAHELQRRRRGAVVALVFAKMRGAIRTVHWRSSFAPVHLDRALRVAMWAELSHKRKSRVVTY